MGSDGFLRLALFLGLSEEDTVHAEHSPSGRVACRLKARRMVSALVYMGLWTVEVGCCPVGSRRDSSGTTVLYMVADGVITDRASPFA